MQLSSGFLLLETIPGREAPVLDALAQFPGVTTSHVLFPAAIAVRIEAPGDDVAWLAKRLRLLEGVLSSRLYRSKPLT